MNKAPKVCKDDEELNPKTERCRKKCNENQVRDQNTGRCKKLSKKASSKKASAKKASAKNNKPTKVCKDDEELNPKTERCRKKCNENQVRDQNTGRCKKLSKKASSKKASSKKASPKKPSPKKPKKASPKKPKKASPKKPKNVKECNICGEENLKIKDFIKCPHCNFEACKSCTETFLLGITDAKPKCMNSACKKLWSNEFLRKHFEEKFIKQLDLQEAKYIITKEKPLLPQVQNLVKDKKEAVRIDNEINKTQIELHKIWQEVKGNDRDKNFIKIQNKLRTLLDIERYF